MGEQTIVLGGGCFWCTEAVFSEVRGVLSVESGYANGQLPHPSYEQVCTGQTGYAEVVQVRFDSALVSVRELLEVFFVIHDPTTLNRQGHDVGTQYRSGIYYVHPEHEPVARAVMHELQTSGLYAQPLVTELQPLASYWAAESYHQKFFARNPDNGYCQAVAAPKLARFRSSFVRLRT